MLGWEVQVRILVTGSRKYTDYWTVRHAILKVCSDAHGDLVPEVHTVVHGVDSGADLLAKRVVLAEGCYFAEEEHLPDRDGDGRAAVPICNQKMVDLGADICLAFPRIGAKNKGTFDCINRCLLAGINVETFPV